MMENDWNEVVEASLKKASSIRYLTKQYIGSSGGFCLVFPSAFDGIEGYDKLVSYPFTVPWGLIIDVKNIELEIYYDGDRIDLSFVGLGTGQVAKVTNLKYKLEELQTFKRNHSTHYFAFTIGHVANNKINLAEFKNVYLSKWKIIRKWTSLRKLSDYKEAIIRLGEISNAKERTSEADEFKVLNTLIKDYEIKHSDD